MIGKVSSAKLRIFFEMLGKQYPDKEQLILLGGCALNLLGSSRPTLDVDYVGDDLKKGAFDRFLEEVAQKLHLDIEAVPIAKFLPVTTEDMEGCLTFGKFGEIDVFILNPYLIAISKVERGFDTDIEDVIFLIKNKYVDTDIMTTRIHKTLLQAHKFDINRNSVMNHWHDILQQL
ncbi:MAG: hypothetical protein K0B14_16875 [Anaerolineaceae bacterium]|nr:hypothetical protein [Anaerolineaceae bacterium]